jgi:Flp pilus assembly secretin CpaC
MFNHLFKFIDGLRLLWVLSIVLLPCFCGCGDFFAHKPTEIQSQSILQDLGQVREVPNLDTPLPDIYLAEPRIIEGKDGAKLFYFTRHHTVEILSALVREQLGYTVSQNPATNQLVVKCPTVDDAKAAVEFLNMVDVPPIQVNVNCLILERFADVTMDWETTIKIDNLLGEKITLGGKTDASGNLLPAFPGASLRESKRATFGLDLGYWKDMGLTGHEFRAIVDMLVSRGYLKILMNPTLEIVNGQKGFITLRDYAPLEMIVTKEGVEPYSLTEYKWVEDILEVTPHVYADGFIGLATKVQLGSKSKPEGVVQNPIITERVIDVNENRIKPGDSLLIGGIRKSEERAVIRGVPFFKDIPVIGVLFSSKDFEEKATEVIFILTPTISSGGVKHAEVIEDIRRKTARPKDGMGLHEALSDPFGAAAYTKHVEQQAAQAEFERLKAQIEKAEALEEMGKIKEELLKAAEEVLAQKTRAAKAHSEIAAAKKEVEKAKADADRLKVEVEKAKAGAERLRKEAENAKANAEKLEKQAEKPDSK